MAALHDDSSSSSSRLLMVFASLKGFAVSKRSWDRIESRVNDKLNEINDDDDGK